MQLNTVTQMDDEDWGKRDGGKIEGVAGTTMQTHVHEPQQIMICMIMCFGRGNKIQSSVRMGKGC